MNSDRDLLKQALLTLEGWANHGEWVWPESALEQAKRNTTEAITALRERLAQPEFDSALQSAAMTQTAPKLAQSEQEPVCAHGVRKTKCCFCSIKDKQPERIPKWQGAQFDSALQSVPAQGTLLPAKPLMRRATREEKIDRPGVYWVPVEPEPVAWQWLDTGTFRKSLPASAEPGAWRPLYTAPQPNTIANSEAIPEQISEPVAWFDKEFNNVRWRADLRNCNLADQQPLYTTPPRREWVGLTEEEQEALWDEAVDRQEHFCSQYGEFADAIEAKLKEKNA